MGRRAADPARRRRLDARRAVGDRRTPRTSRRRPRSTRRASATIRDAFARQRAPRTARGHRRARAAHGARLPAARIPVADLESPHRRATAASFDEPHPRFRSRSSTRCAPRGPRDVRSACGCRAPTGSTAAGRSTTRSSSRAPRRARLRLDRRVERRRVARAEDPARAWLPGAVRARDQAGDAAPRTMAVGLITDARAGARRSSRPATPTWSRWRARSCGIRAGRGTRPPRSAATVVPPPQYLARRAARCGGRVRRREGRAALSGGLGTAGAARVDGKSRYNRAAFRA